MMGNTFAGFQGGARGGLPLSPVLIVAGGSWNVSIELQRDAIYYSERYGTEINLCVTVVILVQPDDLTDKRLAEIDQFTLPFDLSSGANPAQFVIDRIVGILEPRGIGPWRGGVMLGRRRLAQRLVRTLVIELGPEAIEAALLGGAIFRRRFGGLGSAGDADNEWVEVAGSLAR